MTNLEALKSLTEYRSDTDDLFTKALLDRSVAPTTNYVAATAQSIDLSMADIYLYLAGHPEMTEGRWGVKYSREDLLKLRTSLYSKWGLALPENTQSNTPGITGKIAGVRTNFW